MADKSMPAHRFGAPEVVEEYETLLFDMDGTIIESTPAIIKHWHSIGREIGVDGDEILKTSHGRRSIDVLNILAPKLATWDFVCEREGQIPIKYGGDAVEISGARSLLKQANDMNVSWGIVTSGTKPLVNGWLDRMKLSHPRTLVTAEDVARGKPDPACYALGAERVAAAFKRPLAEKSKTLVFEDAPAGIRAGRAAGFQVIALATTHSIEELRSADPHIIVKDLESIEIVDFKSGTNRISIRIKNALSATQN